MKTLVQHFYVLRGQPSNLSVYLYQEVPIMWISKISYIQRECAQQNKT